MALFDSTFPPYEAFGSRTLSQGDTGSDVAIAQSVYNLMLEVMHPPRGPMGSPIRVTGTFDPGTRQAMMNIQEYFGIDPRGTLDPATLAIYGQDVDAHPAYGGPVYGSRRIKLGDSGGDVMVLQNRLNCFQYCTTIGHRANGYYDALTASAVLAFKKTAESHGDTGFPRNTVVDPATFNASWLYTVAGGRNIDSGRNGFDVVFVQTLLKTLGHYSGRVTGYYDGPTKAAVRAFQGANHIAQDGIVGPDTFFQLGLHNRVPAPDPLPVAWTQAMAPDEPAPVPPPPPAPVPPAPPAPVPPPPPPVPVPPPPPVPVPPPPPPVPVYPITVCSSVLYPTVEAPAGYGMAAVTRVNTGQFSIDVTGHNLPDPCVFSQMCAGYEFSLETTGNQPVFSAMMSRMPNSRDSWASQVSGISLPELEEAHIRIYPGQIPEIHPRVPVLEGVVCVPERASCFNGVDNNVDMSSAAPCLASQGYVFVGRYLGGPCYNFTPLTTEEAYSISQAGLLLFSIYVGANNVENLICGSQTYEQGLTDGQDAVNLAQNVGQPQGSAIYLDLQPGQLNPKHVWLGYVQSWAEAVAREGYIPGVYSSKHQLELLYDQAWCGDNILYWVTHQISDAVVTPAPCPSSFLPIASLWQYCLEVTVCDVPGCDIDSAQSTLGMWSL